MMDLGSVKKDFSNLLSQVQPWTLSHFVMWLDIKVAEYKVFGRMIMDNTPNDTPQWLRASADYLEQQQKEAQAQAASSGDKDLSPTVPHISQPPLSPHTVHSLASLRPSLQQFTSNYDPLAYPSSASMLYAVSTMNTTVVSPSISPAISGINTAHMLTSATKSTDTFQKPAVPITSPELVAFQHGSQRIPPISHLSPKHIRQSHLESLSMSLPVSLSAVKESLSTAEVESQIAALESQIAAVNRSLKQSAQVTGIMETPSSSTTSKSGRRKADTTTYSDESSPTFIPPINPKKSRQQSPVRAVTSTSASMEGALPPLHASMDMLARLHRLDTESIPESLRSQNIQSTLEAFEALRTQTFPPSSVVGDVQSSAHDMSLHHMSVDREQMAAYVNTVEQEQPYGLADREQTYTPSSDTASINYSHQQEVRVKVEAGHSDEDSMGDINALKVMTPDIGGQAEVGDGQDDGAYPVSMYAVGNNGQGNTDEKLAAEMSTKKMRRKFLESMKNSNPKYYSHQIQQIIPFPDKFPVANLDYGLKALQMIQTGEITRAGKIQLIDTIFHELIKYTGLYPTPTQKMAVANAIVETFPTLAAKMKASHISPADSWYVILCDKFRNERRGLGGVGASPRVGKGKRDHQDQHAIALATDHQVAMETAEMSQGHVEEMASNSMASQSAVTQAAVAEETGSQYSQANALHPGYQHGYTPAQMSVPKDNAVTDLTTDDDEEEAAAMLQQAAEAEKALQHLEHSRQLSEKKRSVRRKTHSPKRVQKAPEMPILDERYAASLLEYYSKHKPYYPVDTEFNKHMEEEAAKAQEAMSEGGTAVSNALAQAVANQAAVSQAIAQAVASHAVGSDEPYSAEVAAIVQNVVSAHMDEVLAARNYQVGPELGFPPLNASQPPEVEGTVEVKTSKKKLKVIPQKERTPEQQHLTLHKFRQKLAVTYPGVQAVDDCTLLCTCGSKVKLGRARMLHNYSNYHLKRCNNPPITACHEAMSPSMSLHGMYTGQGSPGEINIPNTGPKVIAKELESVAFAGLSAADRETIQKHFLLNVPIPSSDNTIVAGSTSTSSPTQSLDLSIPGSGHSVLNTPHSGTEPGELSGGHNGSSSSTSDHSLSDSGDTRLSNSVLNVPLPGHPSSMFRNSRVISESQSKESNNSALSAVSLMNESQSLDLTVHSSTGPSVLIEHQPGTDLRVQIPSSIATSIAEYSGELPDLSAMNALALIQGKSDQPMSGTNDHGAETANEEPINLAHT
ncbi:uncharacterized protein LOC127867764 [Dreissena polymorpha]|uniref:Uncharacterized protein n=1 Tax=Dreissena polymorpha TaxID=45954 RepID=A0A9D4M3C1_DREPO|nr:uncharacterized protein LOC127867764 [Dreissena polymorpha]KAH3868407.1 hypothetical protein DPMN_031554 [Dreissena polymorpha]